ncbi:MAG: tRNA lysidine(34) synthetase TilS [Cytophagales bacterium]|nr:tRNA lysidine(34) synthetase TilS [Cytophagales bacterium]
METLQDVGGMVKAYQSNAASFQAAEELVNQVVSDFGTINILVNNAGITKDTLMLRMSEKQWDEVMETNGMNHLVTAHHLNDNLETVIYHLSKGTGIAGLRGIPERSGKICRPLLPFARRELEAYARKESLSWREDSSNQADYYARNKIRHGVIPVLQAINPSLEYTFLDTWHRLLEMEALYAHSLSTFDHELREENGQLTIPLQLLRAQAAPCSFLYEVVRRRGFSFHQARLMLEERALASGKVFYSASHEAWLNRTELVVKAKSEGPHPELIIPLQNGTWAWVGYQIHLELLEAGSSWEPHQNPWEAYMDLDMLDGDLRVRSWQRGDWLIPLGMKGRKKVSDLLIDQRVPQWQKDQVPVFISGENMVWVGGIRLDDRYKISPATKRILHLSLLPDVETF